jgi:signal peptidase I
MAKKAKKTKNKAKELLGKFWHFVWEDNSAWSWVVNILLAFIIIKFVVYPLLGFALTTSHPIVAVVSGSMQHEGDFDEWWSRAGIWYVSNNITKEGFSDFALRDGFNKGDIMMLKGLKPKDIKIGDVIVFKSTRPDPIIHRVVRKWQEDEVYYFQTKGDNYRTNPGSIRSPYLDETRIAYDQIIGVGKFRVPFLGWVKIMFVELIKLFVR